MIFGLVASDLDGTLLSSRSEISARNLAVLRLLSQRGVHICIATGRMLWSARAVTANLDVPHTLVTYNGALVSDRPSGEVQARRYLHPADVRRVLAYFKDQGLTGRCDVFTDDGWYVTPSSEQAAAEARKHGLRLYPIPADWPDREAAKVMIHVPRERSRELLEETRRVFPGLYSVLSTATLLEVMTGQASKGQAVLKLAHDLGVRREAIVAFGDQINDVDMLEAVGYGVAMGNAVEDAKRVAAHVTLHHDNDGVAVALESLFALPADVCTPSSPRK